MTRKFLQAIDMTAIQFAAVLFFVVFSYLSYALKWDVEIHNWAVGNLQVGWIQEIFGYLSRMGQAWFQIVVCIVLGFWYYRKGLVQLSRAWYLSIPAFVVAGIVCWVLKTLIGRPRPKVLNEMYDFQWLEFASRLHSYPSGHTITTFCLLATVYGFYGRKVQISLWFIAITLGLARVGINSHWMGDIVLGAALGYLIGHYFKAKWKLDKKHYEI